MGEKPFHEVYAELRRTFVANGAERLQRMRRALEESAKGGAGAAEAIDGLRRDAHGLKGLGGTYGFPLVTEVAARLEKTVAGRSSLNAAERADSATLIDAIERALAMDGTPKAEQTEAFLKDLPRPLGGGDG